MTHAIECESHFRSTVETLNAYSKAPLALDSGTIRILTLAPGASDDILQGDFIVESLDYDDLHYSALSYTWSRPLEISGIVVGGFQIDISRNLLLALHQFRDPARTKNI